MHHMQRANRFVNEQGQALVGKAQAGDDLKAAIDQVVGTLGGLGRLVSRGDTILLKPNFNTADPPPGSSDPLFVRAVIELLYDYGAARVVLGESSMITRSTRSTLAKAGMLDAAREARAEVLVYDEWVRKDAGGRYLKGVSVARAALEAPKIVYATCLKTHQLGQFTMSLKLAVGFMQPRERIALHLGHLAEKVAELNTLVAPDLILMDGRKCFVSGGPMTGERREPGVILASGDRIAIDVEGVRIIQRYPGNSLGDSDPWRLPQIRRAVELGLGAKGPEDYAVVEVGAELGATGEARATDEVASDRP